MSNPVKLWIYDLETTGKDPNKHAIIEIGVKIVIDGVPVEDFKAKPRPFHGDHVDFESLKITKNTMESIWEGKSPITVFVQLEKLLDKYVDRYDPEDKFFTLGFNNCKFDDEFLRNFFRKNGNFNFGSYFWTGPMDLYPILTYSLRKQRFKLPDMKLKTLCKALGILVDEEKLHSCDYDANLVWELYKKLEKKK